MTARWRWVVWCGFAGLWALALLTPQPVEAGKRLLPAEAMFPAAKSLHVGVYALLTAAAAWLPPYRGLRWLPVALVSLHGCGTEFFQQFVPSRHGCLEDVGIDHVGLALGLLLTLPRWRRPA